MHLLAPDCQYDRAHWPARAAATTCVWNKEVRFFSRGPAGAVDFCWYRRRYPCVPPGAPHISFDGSPDYFVLPSARIHAMALSLPASARLVAIIRNPADRFYSAFNMGWNERRGRGAAVSDADPNAYAARRNGSLLRRRHHRIELRRRRALGEVDGALYGVLAESLDRWIACAPECAAEPSLVGMFFDYGLYALHLRRFARHFGTPLTNAAGARPADRILVLKSEDMYADAWAVVSQVLAFAGLAPDAEVEARVRAAGRANAGSLWGGGGYLGRLRPAERAKLLAYYKPHNLELYSWLGRDFGWEREEEAAEAREVGELGGRMRAGGRLEG